MKPLRVLPYEHCTLTLTLSRRISYSTAFQSPKRTIHSSSPKEVSLPLHTQSLSTGPSSLPSSSSSSSSLPPSPLSHLPLSQILRTFLITSISSSPTLLTASSTLLRRMLESTNPLFSPSTNPLLRSLLHSTFYKQFCAGETSAQISRTCAQLRQQGYAGVILEYALEALKDAESDELHDVAIWRKGMLDTIDMVHEGDFVGLKWSGMGPAAMRRMKNEERPSGEMEEAMHAVCKAAEGKKVALLPAAEETWSLNGFHTWCLDLQRVYNRGGEGKGKVVVYTTYQAYLKQTPETLARHLAVAEREGFVLGVKLVRGAYLASEKRELIWPTIEGTHRAYDGMMEGLLGRRYNEVLVSTREGGERWPGFSLVVASHNAATVEKAQRVRRGQVERGEEMVPLAFAQLQGMADEVSCGLITAGRGEGVGRERVFKCATWGSMHQCLGYLLRRAAENKDAASRTADTRSAMRVELVRRLKAGFGFSG